MSNNEFGWNTGPASIEEMVMKIVGDHLGVPGSTLNLEMNIIDDLGADAFDQLELIMTVEELFEIKIPDEELPKIHRIGDIVTAIKGARSTDS